MISKIFLAIPRKLKKLFPVSVCGLVIFFNLMSIEYLKKLKTKSEKVENTAEENPYKRT